MRVYDSLPRPTENDSAVAIFDRQLIRPAASRLTCLNVARTKLGLLINFNMIKLGDGRKRWVLCSPSCSSCPSWLEMRLTIWLKVVQAREH